MSMLNGLSLSLTSPEEGKVGCRLQGGTWSSGGQGRDSPGSAAVAEGALGVCRVCPGPWSWKGLRPHGQGRRGTKALTWLRLLGV